MIEVVVKVLVKVLVYKGCCWVEDGLAEFL